MENPKAMVKMNHYVYLLQSRISNMSYIGVRSCKCLIWDDPYMGSAKYMTNEDKENCNKIVLKRFSCREEAVTYEIELHNIFDVARNEYFWNKAKQTSTGFDPSGMRGRPKSEEHKRRIGLAHKGKIVKEASKLYGSKNPMYGKKHSIEAANKMQATRTKFPDKYWWENRVTNEKLHKTCLEMGKLFDPHKQSSSFTKIVKGSMKSIYSWVLIKG